MNKAILIVAGIVGLNVLSAHGWAGKKLSFERDLSLDADGISEFKVDAGAGVLILTGESVEEITVRATIKSHDADDVDELKDMAAKYLDLNLEENGRRAKLTSLVENKWFGNNNMSVDLEITIPRDMNVEIRDGSGSMEVMNIDGDLDIDDGSGSMFVKDITGEVFIDDGSGEMDIINIGSDLKIDDGSGSLKIDNVAGSVRVDDGSGELVAYGIGGDFTVDDGSGSIKIEDLKGEFNLISGGSGSIRVNGKRYDD
ncbi:hypothetical protein [Marinicella sp. W31]|uniref:hypothetical protein n=1 Tax=Marinicella sp. W31 TaxID=3023713 RepID=UPI003756BDF7